MRIDFHVHSRSSKRASQWVLQKINCPESFTEPAFIYQSLKAKGMTHVTITDHNSIEGALEIAHLPDVFVSEEVTTYFPEDQCKLHVLALHITEAQHDDIQKLRANIYELTDYMNREQIFHIVAHPLYSINGKLSVSHVEKLLLLFNQFEINGTRNQRENDCIRTIVNGITPEDIQVLAERHPKTPNFAKDGKKHLFGGSDDHSGLNIARTYTEVIGARTPSSILSHLAQCHVSVHSDPAFPKTLAHNLYGIAYQYYRNKFRMDRYADKDILMRFLDRSLRGEAEESPGLLSKIYYVWNYRKHDKAPAKGSLMELLKFESRRMIQNNPALLSPPKSTSGEAQSAEDQWFQFVNDAANRVMVHFGDHFLDNLSGANFFDIFHTIGSAGGLYTLLAPYFMAYTLFSKDRALTEKIAAAFSKDTDEVPARPAKIAHFTDTFYDVNGVAKTLQQQVTLAQKTGRSLTVITCDSKQDSNVSGVRNFEPVGQYDLPEYPEQKIHYPPFLEMLNYCYEQNFTHVHTATPGPVGLAALAIAKILRLPLIGTYHTSIPQYVLALTGDNALEEIAWRFMLWYYDQMDVVYAPSESTRKELMEKGISEEKLKLYPRGIDIDFFHPSMKNGVLDKQVGSPNRFKLLYVGRVSKEKNLELLSEAFKTLSEKHPTLSLVVVGDGPYLSEMKEDLEGFSCLFTGYVSGEPLAALYASADLFVFPSTTDTFGNVVMEAQASGIPVIVTDQGGPCENMLPNETGLVVPGDSARALVEAVETLITSPEKLSAMKQAARAYVEEKSFESAFLKAWGMYEQVTIDPRESLFSMVG